MARSLVAHGTLASHGLNSSSTQEAAPGPLGVGAFYFYAGCLVRSPHYVALEQQKT
jgi:hypothetical protein